MLKATTLLLISLPEALVAAAKCNPEAIAAASPPVVSPGTVPLRLVGGKDAGPDAAACLDGSPFGFYFQPSTTGSKKWTISINGGGWCYDEVDCYCRSKTRLGTSTVLPETGACVCSNPLEDGTVDENCNCLHLPYLDGASFAGYRADPWPVPENSDMGIPANASVYFRGIKNFDAVLDFAVAHGMNAADELVVTGGSAGGLSTFLHVDRAAARVPKGAKVRALPVVGYFLDHDNFNHTRGGLPNTAEWSTPGEGQNYTTWMKYIYSMQNLTFGGDGGLTAACREKHPDEPHLCFMSPHMQDAIETPFFMLNSKYDAWQLGNEFQSKWDTAAERAGVLQYGRDFMTQLSPVYQSGETKHGGMITSCICHGCPWPVLELEGKTTYEHYADWFYGRTSGTAAMHIDRRLPNGNGTLVGPTFAMCAKF